MTTIGVCICPGNEVPFYCPRHGRVENPMWPPLFATHERMNSNPAEIVREESVRTSEATFATGEWLSEMGDIIYPEDYGC